MSKDKPTSATVSVARRKDKGRKPIPFLTTSSKNDDEDGGYQVSFGGKALHIPEGLDDMSPHDAALALAEAGWYVLPTDPADIKNPGSRVGGKWHKKSTRDVDQIGLWWSEHPDAGIALHMLRSRAIAFDLDVDDIKQVPEGYRDALNTGLVQHTRTEGDRGHYVFRLRDDEEFGNGAGAFRAFGEVRCKGVIICEPTPHPKGGRYHWSGSGGVPVLPDALRKCLRESAGCADAEEAFTPEELDDFYAEYEAEDRPGALAGVLEVFAKAVCGGGSRHEALVNALPMAFREAVAGCYPARRAADRIRNAFEASFEGTNATGRRSSPAPKEFARTAEWAAAQSLLADSDETLARLDRRTVDVDGEVEREVDKLRVRDRARTIYADEKARDRLNLHTERLLDGLTFLIEDSGTEPLWGEDGQVLWAQGEGLMICGPQGVGKSTIAQQLVLARMGLRDPELFGFPVVVDERPILYLAMDRPPQIRRSLNRMLDATDEAVASALKRQLVVWMGPPPFDVGEASPQVFADWVALHGREPGLVLVDSLKDLASGLANDEVGAAVNSAMQLILANGTEFVELHHQRKANAENRKPDKLADVYGNSWLTAGLGSVLLAWGEPGARTVELSHLKQPQERVGPLIVDHSHGTGTSAASDPAERLTALALEAQETGITEEAAVRALYDVGRGEDGYVARKSNVRRKLNRLTQGGVLIYRAGRKGGKGGGGNAARWTHHLV